MAELSRVVWKEGEDIRSIRGELIGPENDGDFIAIKTLNKIFRINKKDVIKIEEGLE